MAESTLLEGGARPSRRARATTPSPSREAVVQPRLLKWRDQKQDAARSIRPSTRCERKRTRPASPAQRLADGVLYSQIWSKVRQNWALPQSILADKNLEAILDVRVLRRQVTGDPLRDAAETVSNQVGIPGIRKWGRLAPPLRPGFRFERGLGIRFTPPITAGNRQVEGCGPRVQRLKNKSPFLPFRKRGRRGSSSMKDC